ncbi:MAG: response regulator [Caulobacteraceae bacterium]
MTVIPIKPNERINLSGAEVLLADGNPQGLQVLTEMFAGFGVHTPHLCSGAETAMEVVKNRELNLLVIDSGLPDSDGFELVTWLRRSGLQPNSLAPVILLAGHTKTSDICKGRDCGANFVVRKPCPPMVMMQRILWITKEARPFVESNGYCGPDRRFRAMGPPAGSKGRRHDDLSIELGAATEPNLDQTDIDALFSPRKAM